MEGCKLNWPSQRDHLCMTFWNREEDAWLYYYDEAIQVVDSINVWNLAQELAYMLEINIHPSWRNYINELYKLPRTTVYLHFYQIDCFANHSDTRVNQILTVLQIRLMIEIRRKTLRKASLIVYPIEKLKIEKEQNMEVNLINI